MVALFPSPSAAISKLPISSPPAASAAPSPRNLGPDVALGRYLALAVAAVGSTALMRCMVISPLQKNELAEVTPLQIPTMIRFTSDPPSVCPIAETSRARRPGREPGRVAHPRRWLARLALRPPADSGSPRCPRPRSRDGTDPPARTGAAAASLVRCRVLPGGGRPGQTADRDRRGGPIPRWKEGQGPRRKTAPPRQTDQLPARRSSCGYSRDGGGMILFGSARRQYFLDQQPQASHPGIALIGRVVGDKQETAEAPGLLLKVHDAVGDCCG